MKYIHTPETATIPYPADVDRIVEIFKSKGDEISELDAHNAWENYSGHCCAGWLGLPERDEDVIRDIMPYLSSV